MTDPDKLKALHRRLLEEQRRIITGAAEVDALPSAGLLTRIATLESAIVAVEAILEENPDGRPA